MRTYLDDTFLGTTLLAVVAAGSPAQWALTPLLVPRFAVFPWPGKRRGGVCVSDVSTDAFLAALATA